jgi:hypothetical protein
MSEILTQIAAAIGVIVVTGSVLTGLALWLFKLLGEKWISAKFAERLEAFKHDQQKEIEHLRFEINKLFDRTTKLHQWEFEVLPRAWSLLTKSYYSVRALIAPYQSYPDISRMSVAEFGEFLEQSELANWQKDELQKAPDRNKYYQDAIVWPRLVKARKACRKSMTYLRRNVIFMPPPLKEKFEKIESLTLEALSEYQMNKQHDLRPMERAAHKRFFAEGESLIKELEAEVQGRLWHSEKLSETT